MITSNALRETAWFSSIANAVCKKNIITNIKGVLLNEIKFRSFTMCMNLGGNSDMLPV
jgi:hypothetical protein